jgi:7,8-dihydropterin-6-yl-methyl-4-(beta-D-ribofuranosyl)aminobenzene 5'-phosphate synthase
MRLRVTTLSENTTTKVGLLAEHGLSMLLEVDDRPPVLLDTGQTGTAVHNARALGVDLSRVRHLVLSHGHQDHTGGLRDVLAQTGEVNVYAHADAWRPRYAVRKGEKPRYSGLPFVREQLEAMGATFHLSDEPQVILDGVMTTGFVPRTTDFERLDADLKVRGEGGLEQDQIPDDQAVIVKTPEGLVVLLGCAHSGIVNTLAHAREVANEGRIHAVLGGTHLGFASKEQLERTVEALRGLDIQRLGVSHCTGLPAAARLAAEFGERFFFNNCGTVTEL